MEDKYEKALKLLDSLGLRLLQEKELDEITQAYQQDLLNGLAHKTSSLQMLPTYLIRPTENQIYKNTSAIVIEIGGTNICAAHITVNAENNPVIQKDTFYKGKLGKTVFHDPDDFFKEIFSPIQFLFKKEIPHVVAIIYSFPSTAMQTAYDIDVISSNKLPKEFNIPGIENEPIGRLFIRVLKKFYTVPEDIKIVVLNDTPAVLLSDAKASIGVVLGTGFNIAIAVHKQIINTESGGFSHIPQYQIAYDIDQQSVNKGEQFAEKQVSGLYLGQALQKIAQVLEQNHLLTTISSVHTSESISEFLKQKNVYSEHIDNRILQEVAERLSIRSAQIAGTMIGTIIKTFPEDFKEHEIFVPVEGSVFWGIPNYAAICKEFAEKIVPEKTITFLNIDNAGMIGAARTVMQL